MAKTIEGGPSGEMLTDYEKKCEMLKTTFNYYQMTPNDFLYRHNYSDEQIESANQKIYEKQEGRQYEAEEPGMDVDKVFEALLFYAGRQGQIFSQKSFAEPGNEFDDEFRGADVVFGLPQGNGKRDVIFNVDAATATKLTDSENNKITDKFIKSELYAWEDVPGCNKLEFYGHKNTRTRISQSPHYIIGISPASVKAAVDSLNIKNGAIDGIIPDKLRKMILISLYCQSYAGRMACENVEKKSDRTEIARRAHGAVEQAALKSLLAVFKVSPSGFGKAVAAFNKEQESKDETYTKTISESLYRLDRQLKKKEARKAVDVHKKLSDGGKNIVTNNPNHGEKTQNDKKKEGGDTSEALGIA